MTMGSLALALLLACAALPARAEKTLPLSLEAAAEFALGRRVEPGLARARTRAAEARIGEKRAEFLPSINLIADTKQIMNYDPFSGIEISGRVNGLPVSATVTRTVPRYQSFAGIEAVWNLYAGGQSLARVEAAQAETQAAEIQLSMENRRTLIDVATAFWDLHKAQMEQALADDALALAREEERLIRVGFDQGRDSRLDVRGAAVDVTEAEVRLGNATLAVGDKWRRYELALGLAPDAHTARANPRLLDDAQAVSRITGRWLKQMAGDGVDKADAELRAARAEARSERAALYPRVDLYARYNVVGRSDGAADDALSELRRQDRIVGVRMQWNLFDGFHTTHRMERSRAEANVAALRLEQERFGHLRELGEKRTRVEQIGNEIILAEKRLELARLQEKIAGVRSEVRQIPEIQARSRAFATREAQARLAQVEVDLRLAKLALALVERSGRRGGQDDQR